MTLLVQVCGRKLKSCLSSEAEKSIKLFGSIICCILLFTFISCIHFREEIYLDVYQGEPILFEEMLESLTRARIIYIGEVHTLKRHHRFQLRILKALYQKDIPLAIGLEMLPFKSQRYLDAWIEGKVDKKEFLQLINWEKTWGIDFDLYEPVFDFAQEKKIKLLALNVPRSLVKKVARKGLSGLTDEEKDALPPVTPSSQEHRGYLALSLSRHKTLRGEFEQHIYEAQDVWDSTMAHHVVEYLKSDEGKGKTVVVLAGSGHMAYGYGIPERVSSALGLSYLIVLPTSSGDVKFKKEWEKHIERVELTHEDFYFIKRPVADFIFLVPLR